MFAYNPEMVDCLGSLLIRMHRLDEAARLYEELLERVPNYNRAKLHYSLIESILKYCEYWVAEWIQHLSTCVSDWHKLVRISLEPSIDYSFFTVCIIGSDQMQAGSAQDRALPIDSCVKAVLAQILMDQKRYVKAEDNLLSIINGSSSTANNVGALFELATLYKHMNRTTEALEYILMGISACDVNSDVCASLYVLHGDIMKYLKYLDEAAQRDLIAASIDIEKWEQLAKDRGSWRTAVREGCRLAEESARELRQQRNDKTTATL
ncbi:hypothetical protein GQR58_026701 [Nymphon striatum]|nr:hypothetical protein GQR58_026701 [Nymphon striatum]